MISETYTLLIQRLHRKRRVRRTGVSSTTSTSRSEEVRRTGGQVCNDVEAIEPYGALLQRGISRTAARPKGLKRLKGILANRLPPVIEIIPLIGVLLFFAHLALTFDKFGCTRHKQIETSFIWYSALVCLTLTGSKLGGGSEKCKQVCFFAHLALTL